ncbi:MAG TPA: crosslink repair DNA glycosylase YcaQ family protein [Chloroflexia bacterium]|nr:crosslink repair DNA glycosylase YcaQ family protein [Chloroflexia bacterium]
MPTSSIPRSALRISRSTARRLAITRQRLACPQPQSTPEGILNVVRDLGCLQLDPISAVARSHQIVLWSRLGPYDLAEFDKLLWQERSLFEYWAHAASIVLTEDYPVHSLMMRRYGKTGSSWHQHIKAWVEANAELRDHLMATIRERGPVLSKDIEDKSYEGWHSTGWTGGRNVSQMLDYLWTSGQIMVSGRRGIQKLWDLTERCLPDWTPREEWSQHEVVRYAAQKSLRALGVATAREILQHYTRGRYPGLAGVVSELEREGKIERVEIEDDAGKSLPGPYFIHTEDMHLLERLEAGEWGPRTTLLSPFDNLICDRKRTESLFNFYFRIEIYVPAAKREYGYYVLPILHGDRLIGRVDPQMDRKRGILSINALHAEPDAPRTPETARSISDAISSLATFLGAKEIAYPARVPEGWEAVTS